MSRRSPTDNAPDSTLLDDLIGVAPAALRFMVRRLIRELHKRSPESVLAYKQRMKIHVQEFLPEKRSPGESRGSAIIRDYQRHHLYRPDYLDVDGGDDWYMVELRDVYYDGLEVFSSSFNSFAWDERTEHWIRSDDVDRETITAIPVGRIPFTNIVRIDWDGDEYYPYPHIYCRYFGARGTPYSEVILYEHVAGPSGERYERLDGPYAIPPRRSRGRALRAMFRR